MGGKGCERAWGRAVRACAACASLVVDGEPLDLAPPPLLPDWLVVRRVAETLRFGARLISKRVPVGVHQIEYEGNMCHVYALATGLRFIVVCERDYPLRVSISLGKDVLRGFEDAFRGRWHTMKEDMRCHYEPIHEAIREYQTPEKVDRIMRVHVALDETKGILVRDRRGEVGRKGGGGGWGRAGRGRPLHVACLLRPLARIRGTQIKTIDDVLARGEKLDDLLQKSTDLSEASKKFYKESKGLTPCCTIL